MQEIPDQASLDQLPKDKLIVCVSPTGQTAVQVATTLRWLGYDAVVLEFGMGTWTTTQAGEGIVKGDAVLGRERLYPLVTGSDGAYEGDSGEPTMELTVPDESEFEVLDDAAKEMMAANVFDKEYPFNHIFAEVLYERLQDPAQKDNLFLLDIRSAENYSDIGHIEGAVNISWRELGNPENLDQLPTDKLIVVIGDTSMSAGQVTPILQMLGYDAATLRGGLVSWTDTPDSQRPIDAIEATGHPVVFDE
jgi:rhodanese-related sulfurtransferase